MGKIPVAPDHQVEPSQPCRRRYGSRILTGLASVGLAIALTGCSNAEIPGDGGYGSPPYTGSDTPGR